MSIFELSALLAVLAWVALLAHELGHLLTARFFGVGVLNISVGVGPKIIQFADRFGTRWSIAAIPVGSCTEMVDGKKPPLGPLADSSAVISTNTLTSCRIVERAAIYGAGPAVNILLAPVIYALTEYFTKGAVALLWVNEFDLHSAMALTFGLYSLSIGLTNLLPHPSLDGGRLIQLGIEWFRERHNPRPVLHPEDPRAIGWRSLLFEAPSGRLFSKIESQEEPRVQFIAKPIKWVSG
jgi:membrane-associated protease RseP (regulator of RpoE activity)